MTLDRETSRPVERSLRDAIAGLFADPGDKAFFIDFDGTLVDIALSPEDVVVPPFLPPLLADLAEVHGGAVAILTGRAIATVDRFLAPLRLPGCGQHGLELRLPDGSTTGTRSIVEIAPVRLRLAALADRLPDGVLIEDKGLAIAVHYRGNPSAGAVVEAMVSRALAGVAGPFRLRHGKMVVEVTLTGASKGTALRHLMATATFAGRRPIVFGDDLTDDEAFVAARAFGGVSFQVGARVDHRADFEVGGISDVHWLIRDFAVERTAMRKEAV